jgi:streptomycin 6-kinase
MRSGPSLETLLRIQDSTCRRDVVERRLKALTTALRLDYQRALRWSFAQAVLSAIWSLKMVSLWQMNHPTIQLAHVIKPLLN